VVWITRIHGFDNGYRLLAVNVAACTCAICDAEAEHDFTLIAIEDVVDEVSLVAPWFPHAAKPGSSQVSPYCRKSRELRFGKWGYNHFSQVSMCMTRRTIQ